jgi:hypothetical protein
MLPFLKLLYLVALGVGLFFLRDPWSLGGLLVLQLGLWARSRVDPRALLRIGKRLAFFSVVVALTFAFFSVGGRGEDRWVEWLGLDVNVAGLGLAGLMILRVWTLVLASTWVQRSGEPGDLAKALVTARVPRGLALSVDGTLALLSADGNARGPGSGGGRGGGGGGGGGGGRGGGGGGGRRAAEADTTVSFERIRRGDLGFLRAKVEAAIARAERRLADEQPDLDAGRRRDLAIVTGVALVALGLKFLQVLPGLPVAPGHKNVILVPLYLLAASETRTRFGGLWVGMTVGLLSFLLGYGKWGIFELGHFLLPGLLADLLVPLVHGRGWYRLLQLMLLGALLGVGRFTGNMLAILLAGARLEVFVVYTPMLISQVVFGALSGFVSLVLLRRAAAPATDRPGERRHAPGS